ncbi:MarR family winged helix-turn-helix transcriptional regulator [Streptomyces ficellus]|uniref:MarR family transcriptional regulator n=1 Tax=Streptomyces ficellus TaxID=1977088 RepID=A0A6I6FL22_9ACTN|nr:MarR family winged helix-turn-helix transcriptional regulator [Streptomyces ficellus]QGV76856.1 MarR family transcriptional regulator [Streptomyces ficellus]
MYPGSGGAGTRCGRQVCGGQCRAPAGQETGVIPGWYAKDSPGGTRVAAQANNPRRTCGTGVQESRAAVRGEADATKAAATLVALWEFVALCAPGPVPFLTLRALAAVERSAALGVTELGRILGMTPASVSRLCGRLEDAGFLDRRLHAGDRRRAVLVLTPAGAAAVEELRADYEGAIAAALPPSDAQLQAVKEACDTFRANLERVASLGGGA